MIFLFDGAIKKQQQPPQWWDFTQFASCVLRHPATEHKDMFKKKINIRGKPFQINKSLLSFSDNAAMFAVSSSSKIFQCAAKLTHKRRVNGSEFLLFYHLFYKHVEKSDVILALSVCATAQGFHGMT